jgi:hypothetical protein
VGDLCFCFGETGGVGLLAKEKKQREKSRNREWVGKKKKEVTKLMGQQKGGLLTFRQILVDEPIFLGFNLYANIGG